MEKDKIYYRIRKENKIEGEPDVLLSDEKCYCTHYQQTDTPLIVKIP